MESVMDVPAIRMSTVVLVGNLKEGGLRIRRKKREDGSGIVAREASDTQVMMSRDDVKSQYWLFTFFELRFGA